MIFRNCLRTRLARHEFDGRGSHSRGHHRADMLWVAAVLGKVRGIDLVIDLGVGLLHKGDILFHAACSDVPFVAYLHATEPGGGASVSSSDVEIVTVTDNPYRHRVSQRAIASE